MLTETCGRDFEENCSSSRSPTPSRRAPLVFFPHLRQNPEEAEQLPNDLISTGGQVFLEIEKILQANYEPICCPSQLWCPPRAPLSLPPSIHPSLPGSIPASPRRSSWPQHHANSHHAHPHPTLCPSASLLRLLRLSPPSFPSCLRAPPHPPSQPPAECCVRPFHPQRCEMGFEYGCWSAASPPT